MIQNVYSGWKWKWEEKTLEERFTYSLVSVMLVKGASVWMPVTPGGDEVRELCLDDNLFVDDNTDG